VVLDRIIGAVILLAGINVIFSVVKPRARHDRPQSRVLLLAVGAAAGFGSGLTGAGGPLFSVPVMLSLGFAPLMTIGVSQILQLVSAASGTVANAAYGAIDLKIAAVVVPFELLGVIAGVTVAHRADVAQLRRAAGWLCIVAGAFALIRSAYAPAA